MSKANIVAVLADVHGNYLALDACLDYAKKHKIEKYLFLGDYITDHPYPQRVMEQLYDMQARYDCQFIRGNREDYMISYRANGDRQADGTPWRDCSAQGALLYCYENLTQRDIDWFESLPITGVWEMEGAPSIAFCHGSPRKTKEAMHGNPETLDLLAQLPAGVLVKGHHHRHWSVWHKGKRIVCAGSVGNPIAARARPGKPRSTEVAGMAQMLLLHLKGGVWRPEYVLVPYDWQAAVRNLEASGLTERAPVWAAQLRFNLLTGLDPFGVVLSRAVGLYRAASGIEAGLADVPEEYWRRAAEEFGVEV